MPNYSLIFARNLVDADVAARGWGWQLHDELHNEYRRIDTNERARFTPDNGQSLQNLRWHTKVYLVDGWRGRNDASSVMGLIDSGFFEVDEDPSLPPPRPRRRSPEQRQLLEAIAKAVR